VLSLSRSTPTRSVVILWIVQRVVGLDRLASTSDVFEVKLVERTLGIAGSNCGKRQEHYE
jgi:hypothetical protein